MLAIHLLNTMVNVSLCSYGNILLLCTIFPFGNYLKRTRTKKQQKSNKELHHPHLHHCFEKKLPQHLTHQNRTGVFANNLSVHMCVDVFMCVHVCLYAYGLMCVCVCVCVCVCEVGQLPTGV